MAAKCRLRGLQHGRLPRQGRNGIIDISDLHRGIYVITDGTNTVKAIR